MTMKSPIVKKLEEFPIVWLLQLVAAIFKKAYADLKESFLLLGEATECLI